MPWRLGSGRPRGQPSSPIRRGTTRVRGWKGEAVDEVDEEREARSGGRLRGERGGEGFSRGGGTHRSRENQRHSSSVGFFSPESKGQVRMR